MQPFRPFGATPAHLDLKLNNLHSVEMPDFRIMRGGNDPKHTNQDTKEFFKARKRNAWVCYPTLVQFIIGLGSWRIDRDKERGSEVTKTAAQTWQSLTEE